MFEACTVGMGMGIDLELRQVHESKMLHVRCIYQRCFACMKDA